MNSPCKERAIRILPAFYMWFQATFFKNIAWTLIGAKSGFTGYFLNLHNLVHMLSCISSSDIDVKGIIIWNWSIKLFRIQVNNKQESSPFFFKNVSLKLSSHLQYSKHPNSLKINDSISVYQSITSYLLFISWVWS